MSSWRVLSGSVPGVAHLRTGRDCQDAYATRQCESDGTLFAVIADGASDAPFSAVGAHLAAHVTIRIAVERWNRGPVHDKVASWRGYLADVRDQTIERFGIVVATVAGQLGGASVQDFSTTLTLVAARPPWVGLLVIGDGFVVVREGTADYHLLFSPDPPSERAGQTSFVTAFNAGRLAVTEVANIRDLSGIAAGSDGVGDISLEYSAAIPIGPIDGFFAPVFEWAADPDVEDSKLVRFLTSPQVCARTEDDKSLIVAVPR